MRVNDRKEDRRLSGALPVSSVNENLTENDHSDHSDSVCEVIYNVLFSVGDNVRPIESSELL